MVALVTMLALLAGGALHVARRRARRESVIERIRHCRPEFVDGFFEAPTAPMSLPREVSTRGFARSTSAPRP